MAKSFVFAIVAVALVAVAYSTAEEEKPAVDAKPASAKPAAAKPAAAKPAAKSDEAAAVVASPGEDPEKIDWKNVDWRKRLTALQYHITREAGTERPFKNKYWNNFKDGAYKCVSCGLPLFESDSKFDAHCGWPSFDKTIAKDSVTEHVDYKLFAPRTEIRCRRCDAHLGHVFDDGPTDTGLRYCMNSAALAFVPVDKPKKKSPSAEAAAKEAPPASAAAEQAPPPAPDAAPQP